MQLLLSIRVIITLLALVHRIKISNSQRILCSENGDSVDITLREASPMEMHAVSPFSSCLTTHLFNIFFSIDVVE